MRQSVCIDIPIHVPTGRDAPWPKRIKARPQIQRAFDAWYRVNLHRFLVKLEFIRRTDRSLHLAFNGVTRVIDAALSGGEININVTWNELWWDTLISLETYPQRVPGGYVCTECDPLTRDTFSSREALWEADLFEALLEWVNETLASARALHLYGDEGMTNARLVTERSTARFNKP